MATPTRSAPTLPVREGRVAYLDNLKVLLVAAIIAGHSFLGYSGFKGAWPYQNVREVGLGAVSQAILAIPVLPAVLFAMGLFFLISGLVTPGSVARKGPSRFTRERVVRLGIPLAIWTLGIWTALLFAIHREAHHDWTFWYALLHRHPFLEPGPMWFVEVLLIYSLGYAAWRQWRLQHASPFATDARPSADGRAALQGRTLVLLAAGISLATMLVRPAFPFLSEQIGQLKLWHGRSISGCSALVSSPPSAAGLIRYRLASGEGAVRRCCCRSWRSGSCSQQTLSPATTPTCSGAACIGRRRCSPHSKGRWPSALACGYSVSRSSI